MKHISHTIFDGSLNYNFYTFEQKDSQIIWSTLYVPIGIMLFDFILTLLGIFSYIYVLYTGNIPADILPIGIVLAIISVLISSLIVMRLKKKSIRRRSIRGIQNLYRHSEGTFIKNRLLF